MEAAERGNAPHLDDALSALLDGELGDDEAARARSHLAGCPLCGTEMAEVGQVREWLRSLPPVEPPATFYQRIRPPEPAPTAVVDEVGGAGDDGRGVDGAGAPIDSGGRVAKHPGARRRGHGVQHAGAGRRGHGVLALAGCAAATAVVLGVAAPDDPETSPPVGRFIEAHAAAAGGDPVTDLAPVVVPVSFRR